MTRPWTRLLLVCALLIPRVASAQVTPAAGYTPPDDTQSIRLGAVIFYDYTYTKSPKSTDATGRLFSPSVFNVGRTYINVTGNISHLVAFRITPDVTRMVTAGNSLTGSLTFRLKYGYAQINLDDWTGNWNQTWVRLGMQQTAFVDYEENIYRYRFQGTVMVERDGGMSSSDTGATFHTNFPNGYGDLHAGFYNGEGYTAAETNDQKAFQIRGTVRPMPMGGLLTKGLRITGFYQADHYVEHAPRSRAVANVTYEHPRFVAGFDYLTRTDEPLPILARVESGGWSIFVTPFFKEKGNGPELLLRFDAFKPNKDVSATRKRTIAGFSYWFPHPGGNATAALLFDYEQVTEPATVKQQRIALHGLISF